VKAVPGVVRRELLGGLEINPHEIADGVAILDPVQAPDCDAPRIGILGIDPERLVLDPVLQTTLFRFRRTRFLRRRHDAGPQVLQNGPPKVALAEEFLVRLELIKRHVSFFHSIPVAVVAVFGENRLDVLAEMGGRLDLCPPSARTQDRERKHSDRSSQSKQSAPGAEYTPTRRSAEPQSHKAIQVNQSASEMHADFFDPREERAE